MATVRYVSLMIVLILSAAACGAPAELPSENQPADNNTDTATATVIATPAAATETPAQAQSGTSGSADDTSSFTVPAPTDGEATMTTLVGLNVRTGPGTTHDIVGTLPAGTDARIIGQSADGGWWQITCPTEVNSECWASAGEQYSSATNVNASAAAASAQPTATQQQASDSNPANSGGENGVPAPTPTQNAPQSPSPTATVAEEETAPTATSTLAANTTPTATATQADGATPTATATQTQATPTATATEYVELTATTGVPVAQFDNDSLQNAAVSVFFSITGDRNFTYSNAVSYPNGDQEDWVEFEFPNNSNTAQPVWIMLDCTLTGSQTAQLRATLWSNETKTIENVICNQGEQQLTVNNTEVQQLQIHFGIPDDAGVYADYTVTVVGYK